MDLNSIVKAGMAGIRLVLKHTAEQEQQAEDIKNLHGLVKDLLAKDLNNLREGEKAEIEAEINKIKNNQVQTAGVTDINISGHSINLNAPGKYIGNRGFLHDLALGSPKEKIAGHIQAGSVLETNDFIANLQQLAINLYDRKIPDDIIVDESTTLKDALKQCFGIGSNGCQDPEAIPMNRRDFLVKTFQMAFEFKPVQENRGSDRIAQREQAKDIKNLHSLIKDLLTGKKAAAIDDKVNNIRNNRVRLMGVTDRTLNDPEKYTGNLEFWHDLASDRPIVGHIQDAVFETNDLIANLQQLALNLYDGKIQDETIVGERFPGSGIKVTGAELKNALKQCFGINSEGRPTSAVVPKERFELMVPFLTAFNLSNRIAQRELQAKDIKDLHGLIKDLLTKDLKNLPEATRRKINNIRNHPVDLSGVTDRDLNDPEKYIEKYIGNPKFWHDLASDRPIVDHIQDGTVSETNVFIANLQQLAINLYDGKIQGETIVGERFPGSGIKVTGAELKNALKQCFGINSEGRPTSAVVPKERFELMVPFLTAFNFRPAQ